MKKGKINYQIMLFIGLLLSLTVDIFAKTVVCGKIEELTANQTIKLAYFSNRIDYEEKVMTSKITAKGLFYFEFELDEARTFYLKYNDICSEEFFVAPNDSLVIQTTLYSDLIELNSGADKLLKIRKPAYDYDEKILKKEIKKWAKNPTHYFEVRKRELTPTHTYSSTFAVYVQQLIDYRLAYDKLRFALVSVNILKEKQLPHLGKEYYAFIDTVQLNDIHFLRTDEYQYLIMAYMHYQYKKENPTNAENRFPVKYELAERLLEGEVKEFYQTVLLFNAYEQGKGHENEELYLSFLKKIQNEEYKKVLLRQQEELKEIPPLVVGEKAPHFELTDMNGYIIPLNRFEGSVIYLEFWASWCEPCLQQLPYASELKKEYDKVVFIYISLDENEEEWKAMVEKKDIKGVHLRINPTNASDVELGEKYHIESVPHYLIIDKQGKLVNIDAPRPSDKKQIQEILNSLL